MIPKLLLATLLTSFLHGVASSSSTNTANDNYLRIHNASGLVKFAEDVNNGASFSGTTVLLENDISFTPEESKQFVPIGKNSTSCFSGAFDGQGHRVANLAVESSALQFTGLFGYSYGGAAIRNVVVDSSCSFASSASSYVQMGGIVGYVVAKAGPLAIESVVSMADVSFNGTCASLYIGGLVGAIASSSTSGVTIRNCASYGSVASTGGVGLMHMGGVVGMCDGSSASAGMVIANSLSHGTLTHAVTASSGEDEVWVGGIAGMCSGTNLTNCVGGGEIVGGTGTSGKAGWLVGNVGSSVNTEHCHYTSVAVASEYAAGTPATETDTGFTSLSGGLVGRLNEHAAGPNKWVLNRGGHSVAVTINNGEGFVLSSQLVLLPDLAEGRDDRRTVFSGWYTERQCANKFGLSEVSGDAALYGGWQYALALNATEGALSLPTAGAGENVGEKAVVYGQEHGELPDAVRNGYSFEGWYSESVGGERIEATTRVTAAHNRTLYAQWTINNYTAIFDFGNGTVTNKTFQFNETIEYPDVSEREGYSFNEWNESIETMPSHDLTITAQWTINNYTVAFDFSNGTVTNKTFQFNETIEYPNVPEREGYSFNGWNESIEAMPSRDLTITAQWTINNYTATFDFGNGTIMNKTFQFNETIEYPKDVAREGFVFSEWNPSPETMPSHDLTITAQWAEATQYVEITFGSASLSEPEIMDVLERYVESGFSIDRLEVDSATGNTKVIIRFEDPAVSNEFVRKVNNAIKNGTDEYIRKVSSLKEITLSYSQGLLYPSLTFLLAYLF